MQIQSFGVVIQQFVPPLQGEGKMSKKAVERLLFAGKDVFASKKNDLSIIIHGNLIIAG